MLQLKGRRLPMERAKRASRRPRRNAVAPSSSDQRASIARGLPGFDPVRLGELGVSRRELAVLEQVAQGRTNEQIAESLRISPLTVKKHLERMSAKLGAANRAALVAVAWQRSRPARPANGPSGRARAKRAIARQRSRPGGLA